ncbi:DsbA family protein [Thauera humireducens]|uniref:DsbA family protein n=1 Tax=Thauera humireducens TaxID=1134435 RepID=UPI00311F38B7
MAEPIDFYFDFSSPYGYFMAERIDALAAAHGRSVRWRPFLLGAVHKVTGEVPLPSKPLKGTTRSATSSARRVSSACAAEFPRPFRSAPRSPRVPSTGWTSATRSRHVPSRWPSTVPTSARA